MHFAVDVHAREPMSGDERLCTHCVIVFVAMDETEGNPIAVPTWVPLTDDDRRLSEYATQVMARSKDIEQTVARNRDRKSPRPNSSHLCVSRMQYYAWKHKNTSAPHHTAHTSSTQ